MAYAYANKNIVWLKVALQIVLMKLCSFCLFSTLMENYDMILTSVVDREKCELLFGLIFLLLGSAFRGNTLVRLKTRQLIVVSGDIQLLVDRKIMLSLFMPMYHVHNLLR